MPHRAINADLQNLFHLKFDKEMAEVGVFQLLFYLGRNLVVLSLAYYLYVELNYQIWQICFYFMFGQIFYFAVAPFVSVIIQKIGIKHSIAGRPLSAFIFWGLIPFALSVNFWQSMLYMIPLFMIRSTGGGVSLLSYDIFLSHHLNKETRGKSLALLQIAIMAGTVFAPIIGGFVTALYGFEWTVYVGMVFFFLSGVVLMLTPDEKFKFPYTVRKFIKDTRTIIPKPLAYAEFGRVFFDSVIYIIWPIFLVVAIDDISKIGMLAGVSSGFAMIIAYWMGKKMDKQKGGQIGKSIRNGAYRSMLLNFIRGVWWEPITLGIIDSINKINDQTIKVPYDMQFYKWINEKDTLERSHARLFLDQGIYLLAFGLICLSFYLVENFNLVFVACFLVGSMCLWFTQRISEVGRTVIQVEVDAKSVIEQKKSD